MNIEGNTNIHPQVVIQNTQGIQNTAPATDAVEVKPPEKEEPKKNHADDKKENYVVAMYGEKRLSKNNTSDEEALTKAIQHANKKLSASNREFEFSVHERTKNIMIKVKDKEKDEVIREIPSEDILDMVAKMWEMAGILVDEKR